MPSRTFAVKTAALATLAALAAWQGAAIIRAHDIAATRDALRIANALRPTTQP